MAANLEAPVSGFTEAERKEAADVKAKAAKLCSSVRDLMASLREEHRRANLADAKILELHDQISQLE